MPRGVEHGRAGGRGPTERRHRAGYYAAWCSGAAVVLLGIGAAMVVVGAGPGPGAVAAGGVAFAFAAAIPFWCYRTSYVEIDERSGVVRLSWWGDVEEYLFEDVEFAVPVDAGAVVRAVQLRVGHEVRGCPLLHQGQLFRSRRLDAFVLDLDRVGIVHRPTR